MGGRDMSADQQVTYSEDDLLLFGQLMDKYGEMLIRLSYTYVRDRQVSEDIVQDVFLKAYEKRNNFKGNSSYKTYLYRLTINRCYDYLRSWSYKNTVLSDKIFEFLKISDQNTEAKVIYDDDRTQIGKEILALPVKYREVIVLFYYKDCGIDEISNLLDCTPNTVKTRLRRGREKLKGKLMGLERGIWE